MIDKVKIEIDNWDGESLEVSAYDPNDGSSRKRARLAFQPSFFNTDDVDQVIRSIAQACINPVEQIKVEEEIRNSEVDYEKYESLVGQSFEYTTEELYEVDSSDIQDWPERDELIEQYPPAALESVEQILLNDYKYIQLTPFVRKSDNNVVAVYVNTLGGDTPKTIIQAKRLFNDCKALGVPLISDIMYDEDFDAQYKLTEVVPRHTDLQFIEKKGIHFMYSPWTVEYARNAKKIKIEGKRDAEATKNVEFNDVEIQADERSLAMLRDVVVVDSDTTYSWRTANNDYIDLSTEQLRQLHTLIVKNRVEAYQKSFQRKEELEKTSTFAEIDKV